MLGRRGFLGLLGFSAFAAPAALKEIAAEPLIEGLSAPKTLAEYQVAKSPGIEIAYGSKYLIDYRKEVAREYLREVLFAPYIGLR